MTTNLLSSDLCGLFPLLVGPFSTPPIQRYLYLGYEYTTVVKELVKMEAKDSDWQRKRIYGIGGVEGYFLTNMFLSRDRIGQWRIAPSSLFSGPPDQST